MCPYVGQVISRRGPDAPYPALLCLLRSPEDVANVGALCDQVIALSEYRAQLYDYLRSRMAAVAPNLTVLVGELVSRWHVVGTGGLGSGGGSRGGSGSQCSLRPSHTLNPKCSQLEVDCVPGVRQTPCRCCCVRSLTATSCCVSSSWHRPAQPPPLK